MHETQTITRLKNYTEIDPVSLFSDISFSYIRKYTFSQIPYQCVFCDFCGSLNKEMSIVCSFGRKRLKSQFSAYSVANFFCSFDYVEIMPNQHEK